MKTPKHLATAMAVAMVATSVAPVMAATTTSNEEIIGKNRTETAVKISQDGWKKAETVILVNDSAIPDALTATPLAYAKNAPILLTGKDGLSKETADEIKRLAAKDVIMIGGDAVLTSKVEEGLKALKLKVDRIKGSTREETALAIAKRLDGIKDVSEIAVVNGTTGLADAVSVAAAAAEKGMPILLANPKSGLTLVEKFIKDESIKSSFIIGGDKAVSNEIAKNLPGKQRIEGANRNETNAKVIEKFYADRELDNLYVAKDGMENSGHLIDALAVGSLAAKNGAPVLIASKKLNEKQINVINTKKISTITQVGGNGNEKAFGELKEIEKSEVIKVKNEAELQEALKKANANDVIEIESSASISKDVTLSTNNAVEINVKGDLKGEVTVKAPNADIKNSGTIGTLVVENGKNTTVTNTSGGKIDKVEVSSSSENVKVENKGTITQVENNATGTTIENNGTISKPVTGTTTPTIDGNKPGGSTSGGSGGSSSGGSSSEGQEESHTIELAKENKKFQSSTIGAINHIYKDYIYTGDIKTKPTSENSMDIILGANYDNKELNENSIANSDLEHFLGGLNDGYYLVKDEGKYKKVYGSENIKFIEYNNKQYTWNKEENAVSKWKNKEGANLLEEIKKDNKSNLPEINMTFVDKENKKLDVKIKFEIKEASIKINETNYSSLKNGVLKEVEKVKNNDSKKINVSLTKDATGAGIAIFGANGIELTMNLNNHKYTLEDPGVGSPGTESQGFHLEKGNTVTIENGKIDVAPGRNRIIMMFQNYCTLNLKDLILTGGEYTQYVISLNYAKTNMKNVSVSMNKNYKGSIEDTSVIDVDHNYKESDIVGLVIENDTDRVVDGLIKSYCGGADHCGVAGCSTKLQIVSGRFRNTGLTKEKFETYVKEGSKLREENGDFVVEKNTTQSR